MGANGELAKKVRAIAKSWVFGDDRESRMTLMEAADALEELAAKMGAANMERSLQFYNGGWIPAEDRLPQDSKCVLVTCSFGESEPRIKIGRWFAAEHIWRGRCKGSKVLAWRPLPEPYRPQKEEGE